MLPSLWRLGVMARLGAVALGLLGPAALLALLAGPGGYGTDAPAMAVRLLGDGTPDTGCGIKVMQRAAYMELPKFDHMHRFLPALFQRAGGRVISVPVNHRPRARGTSKYGMLDRLWVGIVDIGGVMWLRRRYKPGLAVREE